ncbi:20440_t:CDS:2 [Cetraspora pellucida]|uniref:20440_t:CDS:1 n=1 Tax=Cetraspora pellucida TaxID=1433469 RepID=A0A9N9CNP6_9GLOM|nr:20440_t:CDS:2 [Cetraspora pellucida]
MASIFYYNKSFSILPFLTIFTLSIIFPSSHSHDTLTFDPTIPSCVACQQNFSSVDSCTSACIAFQNFSAVISDPSRFGDALRCACLDSFQQAYALCLYCFQLTNQTQKFLDSKNIPPTVDSVRYACAFLSAVTHNASGYNATATASTYKLYDGIIVGGAEALINVGIVGKWKIHLCFDYKLQNIDTTLNNSGKGFKTAALIKIFDKPSSKY